MGSRDAGERGAECFMRRGRSAIPTKKTKARFKPCCSGLERPLRQHHASAAQYLYTASATSTRPMFQHPR